MKFSVRGRDLAGTIAEVKARLAKNIKLPYDTHLTWAGEIAELDSAEARLLIIVPITLLVIAFLIYFAVKGWVARVIVLLDIPLACTGGVLALMVTGTHFSQYGGDRLRLGIRHRGAGCAADGDLFSATPPERGAAAGAGGTRGLRKAVPPGADDDADRDPRLALPSGAVERHPARQAQKPLAIVVIGGALNLMILTRLMQPPLCVIAYRWLEERQQRKALARAT